MTLGLSYQAWRNLRAKPLQTALSLALLAFGVGMVSLMLLTEKQVNDAFARNIKDIDLVLGAKGSPLQLILANVYHIDAPTGNILQSEADKVLKHPYIASGIPLAYGDNHEGYRIVGTDHTYVEHYGAEVNRGRLWSEPFEVTLGARVAAQLNMELGDTFFSAHGLTDQTDVHTDKTFTVVGILEANGSVLDQLILTPMESIWNVHAHEGEVVDPATREITAMLLKKRNPLAVLTLPNVLRETNMQVALPAIEVNRMTQQFGLGTAALRAIAMLIMALSFASIFISVLDNIRARRHELALMRTMGGTPATLYRLLLLEGGLLSVAGTLLGLALSRVGMAILGQVVENQFHYDLDAFTVLPSEGLLVVAAVSVGLLASAIPARSSLRLDISQTLSEA
ncbi:MAG: ABC transporter permease [Bacteroidetes bacterium]|nr:ABC transporter permease [Bacteroidota bacterium]MDA0904419.1 ABC transporter permease [Bacteroidota bacterium]MDA1243277.1 ABC transporter permease [Bacteroidota bacterium]